jgi:hypothetical protein
MRGGRQTDYQVNGRGKAARIPTTTRRLHRSSAIAARMATFVRWRFPE